LAFRKVYSVLKVEGAAAWVKVKNREHSQARGRGEMFEGFPDLRGAREFTPR